jgi:DNA-binding MarR family transcriptional regulator
MTTLIRAMQQRGLIRRTPDPRDGRAYRIRLTARARRFQPIAERVAGDLEQMVADRLAPSDLAQLRMTLRVMGASRAPATERTA